MSKKPDGLKSVSMRRHKESNPDFPQSFHMSTRAERRERKIEIDRFNHLKHRRAFKAVMAEVHSKGEIQ